jgi:NAD(P)-dependent dehydrogenase (short-subunit alcohol dehydrogenase family)
VAKEVTKNYQPEAQRLCVREDGYLCMANTMGINASMGNSGMTLRPYPGSVSDPPEVIQAFLKGTSTEGSIDRAALEAGRFNFDNMSRAELCDFAMDEWGFDLNYLKTAHATREMVKEIKANGGRMPEEGAPPAPAAVVQAASSASSGIGVKA